MARSNVRKYLLPSIALASAVSLAGAAWAADLASDAQEQARELLAPTRVNRSITFESSARGSDYAVDPQEQARQLLSGRRSPRAETTPVKLAAQGASTDHEDAQTQARRLILGGGNRAESRTAPSVARSSVARHSGESRSPRTP
jgi:hypothetical protein